MDPMSNGLGGESVGLKNSRGTLEERVSSNWVPSDVKTLDGSTFPGLVSLIKFFCIG